MKVKLTRRVLVTQVDNMTPQPVGTVVDIDDAEAKEMIANGIAEETSARATPEEKLARDPSNKMAGDADNKDGGTATRTPTKTVARDQK